MPSNPRILPGEEIEPRLFALAKLLGRAMARRRLRRRLDAPAAPPGTESGAGDVTDPESVGHHDRHE